MTIDRILVTGLPRCGSSLTMQMLAAGGISTIGRHPDFEVDRATPAQMTRTWLESQRGAVKVLEPQRFDPSLFDLSGNAIIWLERNPEEQAKSQVKFLEHVAGIARPNRKGLKGFEALLRSDVAKARRVFGRLSVPVLMLTFEDLVTEPDWTASTIASFLKDVPYSPAAMARAVRPRGPACLPHMLELELVA